MAKVSPSKIVAMILSLCLVALVMVLRPEGVVAQHDRPLKQVLQSIPGWQEVRTNALSPVVIDELKLDDYFFQTFKKNNNLVTVYIGYYFSGKKVGAAHDPQVCYPGQGWKLSGKKQLSYPISGKETLEYARIVAQLDDRKEVIFYWFQVDDKTVPNTFQQKLLLFQKKLLGHGEGNAFVRISTSLNDKSPAEANAALLDFIDKFYPEFVRYISGKA